MGINDVHIEFLEWVSQGRVTVKNSRYVSTSWAHGHITINQLVAIHVEALGLTHIVASDVGTVVALTARGLSFLEDEREAWG